MHGPTPEARLNVVLVTAGEPLPDDRPDIRLHRTGQLAAWLAARGHRVTWVTNRFDHFQKIQRSGPETRVLAANYELRLLPSPGYNRNVSFQRLRDHAALGREFSRRTIAWERPDVVVAAMPTIELAYEAALWAKSTGAASIIDIRDLWPDVLIERAPAPMRWAVRLALSGLTRKLRTALQTTDAIVSPNREFVEWGCHLASRDLRETDLALPLGYERREISPSERTDAHVFWRSQGLDLSKSSSARLVFAGSLSSQFNFQPVLEAAEKLADDDVQVVLCGTGEQSAALRHAASARPNLFLPGWCSYSQLRVLLEHALLGLMPYRESTNFHFAMPNKAAEYLAHGLPLAWSLGTGSLAELIDKHDLGISYGDRAQVLADYVRGLRSDVGRRAAMHATALDIFRERFEAATVHARTEALLLQLAHRSDVPA